MRGQGRYRGHDRATARIDSGHRLSFLMMVRPETRLLTRDDAGALERVRFVMSRGRVVLKPNPRAFR